jgi:hypothetical protein
MVSPWMSRTLDHLRIHKTFIAVPLLPPVLLARR